MRRFLGLFLALLMLIGSVPAALGAGAAPNGNVTLWVNPDCVGEYESYTGPLVRIRLNGKPLTGDVPAFTWGGRTMVPVRLIAENLGADVEWLPDTNEAVITLGVRVITLKLGSAEALVNGRAIQMYDGVPAMVANYSGADRTMVPLRFISEQLGARVDWEQETHTAIITAGEEEYRMTGVSADEHAIHIGTTGVPEYIVTDFGDRVAVDLLGAELAPGLPGTVIVDNELVSRVRFAQHDGDLYPTYAHSVRVVLDLKEGAAFPDAPAAQSLPDGLLIPTSDAAETPPATAPDAAPVPEVPSVPAVTPVEPQKKTIVLDAGHGGSQAGAVYEGINEKDINLAVTQKLESILRGYGYNVVMTRSSDITLGLYERADIANRAGADIFVSLHSNVAEKSPAFTGIYTYYHPLSKTGAGLAQAIQTPVCQATGAVDRGIEKDNFVVLRETKMCAVLVEMGFMTNSEELRNLTTPSYQDKLAAGIAAGIVSYLNRR